MLSTMVWFSQWIAYTMCSRYADVVVGKKLIMCNGSVVSLSPPSLYRFWPPNTIRRLVVSMLLVYDHPQCLFLFSCLKDLF